MWGNGEDLCLLSFWMCCWFENVSAIHEETDVMVGGADKALHFVYTVVGFGATFDCGARSEFECMWRAIVCIKSAMNGGRFFFDCNRPQRE